MIAFLRTWILNIVIVIIFITFLEILLPNSNMKKYIKLVIGLLVMIVILNPIFELINGKFSVEDEILKTVSVLEQQSLPNNVGRIQQSQDQQILELYKAKIGYHIKEKIRKEENVEVIEILVETNNEKESERFGEIQRIELVISPIDGEKDKKKDIKETIEPIQSVTIELNNENNKSQPVIAQKDINLLIDKIKSSISEFYDLSKDNIYINIK